MLDTGHLLNNNIELKNIDDGVEHIKNCIKNLGEYKKYIRGVHLNYSLSGEYVKESFRRNKNLNLFEHIGKIDYHNAFEHREIKNILDDLKLDYLVYELIAKNDEELEKKIIQQEMALNNLK